MGAKEPLTHVVLDTNVIVSALIFTGPSNQFVDLWQSGRVRVMVSAALLKELARVLA